jgi:quinol monooxygenase YgiN
MMTVPQHVQDGVWILVDFYIQPDKIAEAEKLFQQHVADGRNDRGNLFFSMLRRSNEPGHFVSLEAWETMADIENHDAQPHHPIFLMALAEIQSKEKDVHFLDFFAEGKKRT